MKLQWILGGALALSLVSCESKEEIDPESKPVAIELKNQIDSTSYAMGINLADVFIGNAKLHNLKIELVKEGFDAFNNSSAYIDEQLANQVIGTTMQVIQAGGVSTANIDTLSYALGVNIAGMFKAQKVTGIDKDCMALGFSDYKDSTTLFTPKEATDYIVSFFEENSKKISAPLIELGAAFLDENGLRPEVTTLPSGLQYEIIKEGNGAIPTMMNTVKAHYHGTLIDGTVFDSSIERGKPIDFQVGGVIKGWTEALQLMPVGSKWKLYIPYNLAYGERGSGPVIKPYSTLIFEVELLEIVK